MAQLFSLTALVTWMHYARPSFSLSNIFRYSPSKANVHDAPGFIMFSFAFSHIVSSFMESAKSQPAHVNLKMSTKAGNGGSPSSVNLPFASPASISSAALKEKTSSEIPGIPETETPSVFLAAKTICRITSISTMHFYASLTVCCSWFLLIF